MTQNFSGQNLQGRSFQGQDLAGANFSNADIRGANFSKAILRGANFSHVQGGLRSPRSILLVGVSLLVAAAALASLANVVRTNAAASNHIDRNMTEQLAVAVGVMATLSGAVLARRISARPTSVRGNDVNNRYFAPPYVVHNVFLQYPIARRSGQLHATYGNLNLQNAKSSTDLRDVDNQTTRAGSLAALGFGATLLALALTSVALKDVWNIFSGPWMPKGSGPGLADFSPFLQITVGALATLAGTLAGASAALVATSRRNRVKLSKTSVFTALAGGCLGVLLGASGLCLLALGIPYLLHFLVLFVVNPGGIEANDAFINAVSYISIVLLDALLGGIAIAVGRKVVLLPVVSFVIALAVGGIFHGYWNDLINGIVHPQNLYFNLTHPYFDYDVTSGIIALIVSVYAYVITFATGRTSFCGAGLTDANFTQAKLQDSDFTRAKLENTIFTDAKF